MYDEKTMESISLKHFQSLIDAVGKPREQIAREVEMDASTITKYYNGDRHLSVSAIRKFANYFNVSSDYLLGLSNAPTNDKNLQAICDYTGIDVQNVLRLNLMVEDQGKVNNTKLFENFVKKNIDIEDPDLEDRLYLLFNSEVAKLQSNIINDIIATRNHDQMFKQVRRFHLFSDKLHAVWNTLIDIEKSINNAGNTIIDTEIDEALVQILEYLADGREKMELIQFYTSKIEQTFIQSIEKRIENTDEHLRLISEIEKKFKCIKDKIETSLPKKVNIDMDIDTHDMISVTLEFIKNQIDELTLLCTSH